MVPSRIRIFQQVPLEISETKREITITAALPRFTEKDLELRVEPRRLIISGQHEERSRDKKKGEMVYSEGRYDQVYRVIDLAAEVDPNRVKATFTNGKLEVSMPKKEVKERLVVEGKAA